MGLKGPLITTPSTSLFLRPGGAQEQLGPEELGQVLGQVLGPRHEVRRIEARDGREEERRQVACGGEALLDDGAQIVEGIGPQERGEVEPQELAGSRS